MRFAHLLTLSLAALSLAACGSSTPTAAATAANANSTTVATAASDATGSATFSGIVGAGNANSSTIKPQGAIYSLFPTGQTNQQLVMAISDTDDLCAQYTNNVRHPGSHTMVLLLYAADATGNTVAPTTGTYKVVASSPASGVGPSAGTVGFAQTDFSFNSLSCSQELDDSLTLGQSGTLTLTAISTTQLTGSFSVKIGNGTLTTVSGTFSAAPCAALGKIAGGASPPHPICQ